MAMHAAHVVAYKVQRLYTIDMSESTIKKENKTGSKIEAKNSSKEVTKPISKVAKKKSRKKDSKKARLEKLSMRATKSIGSVESLIAHTVVFVAAFSSVLLGVSLERVLLVLTTILSLEAIYLAIFIQMSVNQNTLQLLEVERDIEEISEDLEEISEDIEGIEKDIEEIQEDMEEITEDIEEMSEDLEEMSEHEKELSKNKKEA
jgi:methyl-accepting chemotaxis protein